MAVRATLAASRYFQSSVSTSHSTGESVVAPLTSASTAPYGGRNRVGALPVAALIAALVRSSRSFTWAVVRRVRSGWLEE